MIAFTVFGKPAPQGSKTARMRRGMRYPVVLEDNPRTKPWRALVSLVASQHRPETLITGPVKLTARFYFARPKSVRRADHTVPPDCSKLVRAAEDSLKGIVWRDDCLVVQIDARKLYGDPPRAEIEVEELQTTHALAVRRPTAQKQGSVDARQSTGRKSPRGREIVGVAG